MLFKGHLRLLVIAGCAVLGTVNCAHEAEKRTMQSDADLRESDSRDGDREGPCLQAMPQTR